MKVTNETIANVDADVVLVLVLGATGQQSGSVAKALKADGWGVRALVRDPLADKAKALAAAGIETVRGDLGDIPSLRAALDGVYGVFSVQPSSGQGAAYGVSDQAKRAATIKGRLVVGRASDENPGPPRSMINGCAYLRAFSASCPEPSDERVQANQLVK